MPKLHLVRDVIGTAAEGIRLPPLNAISRRKEEWDSQEPTRRKEGREEFYEGTWEVWREPSHPYHFNLRAVEGERAALIAFLAFLKDGVELVGWLENLRLEDHMPRRPRPSPTHAASSMSGKSIANYLR